MRPEDPDPIHLTRSQDRSVHTFQQYRDGKLWSGTPEIEVRSAYEAYLARKTAEARRLAVRRSRPSR